MTSVSCASAVIVSVSCAATIGMPLHDRMRSPGWMMPASGPVRRHQSPQLLVIHLDSQERARP